MENPMLELARATERRISSLHRTTTMAIFSEDLKKGVAFMVKPVNSNKYQLVTVLSDFAECYSPQDSKRRITIPFLSMETGTVSTGVFDVVICDSVDGGVVSTELYIISGIQNCR
jgi:hypothetical protein